MVDISVLRRKNFSAGEFLYSETACEKNIKNEITDVITLINLSRTADKIQEIRMLLGLPIKINSGYRCLELNRAVGSKDTSQHLLGQAADFVCPKFGEPLLIARYLKSKGVTVDQLLMEGNWIHVSIKESGKNRNQFKCYLPDINGDRILTNL